MFTGSNSTETRTKLYTGMTVFNFLAINPSKEEIEKIIGKEYKLNVSYDVFDLNGRQLRPIEIWLQDKEGYMEPVSIRFLIGRDDDITQNGSIRFVNDKGVFTFAKSEDALRNNEKQNWYTKFPFRIAKVGEHELFTFLQKLMRYNNFAEEANFMNDAASNGVTIENIFNNDLKGLRTVLDWCKENNNQIVMIAAVRSTSKIVDGEPKVYYNQTLVTNPQYFYTTSTGEVSAKSITNVKDEIAKGQRVSKYMYTVNFQPFVKEECINSVPEQAVSATGGFDPLKLL
jgi:hypothetical protein